MRIVATPRARPLDRIEETSGMVLIAGAPIRGADDRILGALCGGVLVNRNFGIVDRVWELVFKGDRFGNQDVGSVTIFQNDLRVSTTVTTLNGDRAVGTRPPRTSMTVCFRTRPGFRGRAFVVRTGTSADTTPF
jgi:two-component system NtrC family sensor kinase